MEGKNLEQLVAEDDTQRSVVQPYIKGSFIQQYREQRRWQFARSVARTILTISAFISIATLAFFIASGTYKSALLVSLVVGGSELLIIILMNLVLWAVREHHTRLAVGCIAGLAIVGTCGLPWAGAYAQMALPSHVVPVLELFFALNLAIVVMGWIGTLWLLTILTLVLSGYALIAILYGLPHFVFTSLISTPNDVIIFIMLLISYWVTYGFMMVSWIHDHRMLTRLDDAQEAIAFARQLDDLKDQFISSVNHELRNPLMAMMNYVTILRQRHENMPVDRRTVILKSLEDTGRRVIALVGSVLDVRQSTAHPEEFDARMVPVAPMVRIAAGMVAPEEARMEERTLNLRLPQDLEIWGNDVYLQQILTNLISNAVKYSPPGTDIDIEAHRVNPSPHGSESPQNALIEITVKDYGLGIPPDQVPLLFNRFVRLPRDLTSSVMGNGLGLYLCKVLTEAMGGTIWVESTGVAGQGSIFHIQLPATPNSVPQPARVDAAKSGIAPIGRVAQANFARNVQRIRLIIGALLAIVIGLAGALATLHNNPGNAVRSIGSVQFSETSEGIVNGLRLRVNMLPPLPAGAHYQAWLIDTTSENILPLGDLTSENQEYTLNFPGDFNNDNLLGQGTLLEITQENTRTVVPQGNIAAYGTFPTQSEVHVNHLLLSFPTTPNKIGLFEGVVQQTDILDTEAHQLNLVASKNPPLAQCLTQSMLNTIEGTQGAHYRAPSRTCATFEIVAGDGFGLLAPTPAGNAGYIDLAIDHASLAIQQPDATTAMQRSGRDLIQTLNALASQLTQLDIALATLSPTSSVAEITSIVALADQAYLGQGQPVNNGSQNNAVTGGVKAAISESEGLVSITLVAGKPSKK